RYARQDRACHEGAHRLTSHAGVRLRRRDGSNMPELRSRRLCPAIHDVPGVCAPRARTRLLDASERRVFHTTRGLREPVQPKRCTHYVRRLRDLLAIERAQYATPVVEPLPIRIQVNVHIANQGNAHPAETTGEAQTNRKDDGNSAEGVHRTRVRKEPVLHRTDWVARGSDANTPDA